MRKAFLASSAAILVLACASVVYTAPDNTPRDHPDLANLKGQWMITSVEGDGLFRWQQIGAGVAIRIDNVSLQPGSSLEAIRDYYVVSPLKTPKEVDVTYWGDKQFATQHGIYQLSGYTLTLCMASSPAARPTKFAAEPGKSTLIVLERVVESLAISGRVVDDATGKPVTNFSVQGGFVNKEDPTKITWGYWMMTGGSQPNGDFSTNLGWSGGERSRILASGYVSQPILLELPKDGGTNITGLVVRLKRGRQVSGHVLDHTGKPVKDAGVYVVGNPGITLTGGKAVEHDGEEDKKAIRVATDADGAFTVTGIGEDAQRIAVSCAALDLWVVAVPKGDAATDNMEIRLPQPGKLIVHYDIAGASDKAKLFMQLHTWDMPGWSGVSNNRHDPIQQHVETVLDNLPPGDYTIDRCKNLGLKYNNEAWLDRRTVKVESGKATVLDFVRPKGAPITGQVLGLDQGEVAKAKPTRVDVRVVPPKGEGGWLGDSPRFDSIGMEPGDKPMDGKFTTERIPPGQYKVRVEVYIPETEEQRHSTGIVPPGFEGEVLVTVPEEGLPEPVKIPLAPFKFPAR
jgi:uncharacterized protein (TIGR03067 family)